MFQVTFTVTLCFNKERKDHTIIMKEHDTALKLTDHLSKYMYGGLPVGLYAGREKIKDDEMAVNFKGENLWSELLK
jgi:hypothetical protein